MPMGSTTTDMTMPNKTFWNEDMWSLGNGHLSGSPPQVNFFRPPEVNGFGSSSQLKSQQQSSVSNQKEVPEDWFHSHPKEEYHGPFLQRLSQMLLSQVVFEGTKRDSKVVEWKPPHELKEILDLDLKPSPLSHEELLHQIEQTIRYSVRTGHPHFVNQLFSGLDPYGLAGQWVTDALNPSVYTYEVAPVFSLMEEAVLSEMRRWVGFSEGDGIFCPGGSMANGYAISCARYKFAPEIKKRGLCGLPRLVVLTSEDAHYSIQKMAALLGLGEDNAVKVKTDAQGRMDPIDLETQVLKALEDGARPFMVSSTSGTTVLGAFDPIPAIAAVCKKYNLWLHVDAAWGGGALMSRLHRHKMEGIESADSVTWNPHKLLGAPQQCSTFLTCHKGLLGEAHSAHASYLFQKDKCYDPAFDSGDKHVQCGRRADVYKFWLMWKAKGSEGLEHHVDRLFELSSHLTRGVKSREGFQLVLQEPECTNVCFWYVPPSLRGQEDQPDFNQRLHKVASTVKGRMLHEGSMMVTYQPLRTLPNFFRIVLQNSGLGEADMDFFLDEIERLGKDL